MPKIKKEDLVEGLITSNVGWTEDDRDWLMGQSTDRLQRMLPAQNKSNLTEGSGKAPGAGAIDEEEESGETAGGQTAKTLGGTAKLKKMAKNAEEEEDDESVENEESDLDDEGLEDESVENEEVSVEEYINAAPKGIREVLSSSLHALNAEKRKLISSITANSRNKFSREQLAQKEISELRQIATLASNDDSFEGAQGEAPIGNSEEEGLSLPTLNFSKEDKQVRRKTA